MDAKPSNKTIHHCNLCDAKFLSAAMLEQHCELHIKEEPVEGGADVIGIEMNVSTVGTMTTSLLNDLTSTIFEDVKIEVNLDEEPEDDEISEMEERSRSTGRYSAKGQHKRWKSVRDLVSTSSNTSEMTRSRRFNTRWLTKFPWLRLDDSTRTMFCKLCEKHKVNNDFVNGSQDFREAILSNHQASTDHEVAVDKEDEEKVKIEQEMVEKKQDDDEDYNEEDNATNSVIRSLFKKWQPSIPWLRYDKVKDKIYCQVCRIHRGDKHNGFVMVSCWTRITDLKRHESSGIHKSALIAQLTLDSKNDYNDGGLNAADDSDLRQFIVKWFPYFPWLRCDDFTNRLHCQLCERHSVENDFVTGSQTFTGSTLVEHTTSPEHKKALKGEDNFVKDSSQDRADSISDTFDPKWLPMFPWLRYDDGLDLMFCQLCEKYKMSTDFVSGSNIFILSALFKHNVSTSHKQVDRMEKNLARDTVNVSRVCTDVVEDSAEVRHEFNKEWLSIYSWLQYNETDQKILCQLCKRYRMENEFVNGTQNFSQSSILGHLQSHDHQVVSNRGDENQQDLKSKCDALVKYKGRTERFNCVCGKTFVTSQHFWSHLYKSHLSLNENGRHYQCKICNKEFDVHYRAKSHMKHVHVNVKSHHCKICKRAFNTRNALITHSALHVSNETTEIHVCDICSKSFLTKEAMILHSKSHSTKPFECDVCKRTLSSSKRLMLHIKTHKACEVCGKTYENKAALTKHLKLHAPVSSEKPFKCDVCGKSYKLNNQLQSHILVHRLEKTYKCNLCPCTYSKNGHLRLHKKRHHNIVEEAETSLKCEICNFVVSDQHALEQHRLQVSHTVCLFSCYICSQEFFTSKELLKHVEMHHGLKCPFCEKSFPTSQEVEQHKGNPDCEKLAKGILQNLLNDMPPDTLSSCCICGKLRDIDQILVDIENSCENSIYNKVQTNLKEYLAKAVVDGSEYKCVTCSHPVDIEYLRMEHSYTSIAKN
ncbi:uncharacterized protein LOC126810758 [Patella vulgata]|uniref:uncharacterized protein LOC126810758 n=1 Tax=Patella vulgata TaxID=6465 RepID=UPI00217F65C5|nr:uncharacterized protein LOC126810758 [Patella vulgata]XP_050391971.1 uncharacterized protein LOC126810758 [Patella vulgata]